MNVSHAGRDGVPAVEVFDFEQSLMDLYTAFCGSDELGYSETYDWAREGIETALYGHSVLVLDRIEIVPDERGKGVLDLFYYHVAQKFALTAPLVLGRAFPLQFERNVTDENRQKFDKASAKLIERYQRLGYRQVEPGSPFIWLDLSAINPTR